MGEMLIIFGIIAVEAIILKVAGVKNPFSYDDLQKFINENPNSKVANFLKD